MVRTMKDFNLKMWSAAMKIGNICGCHQKPERSFFICTYQFPVCARCFGIWCGYIMAPLLYKFYKPSVWLCMFFMLIMFCDWLLQYLEIFMSNNIRRLITGILCGYGIINIAIKCIMIMVL